MPPSRVSKGFKDISLSFQYNPINNDLIAIKNETAIARSVRNIAQIALGEKLFDNRFGSQLPRSLFDNLDQVSADMIAFDLEATIKEFEPRVELVSVSAFPNYDENNLNVVIDYRIIGLGAGTNQLSFALTPTRR
jgi:phage baseplate assembly protein W